MVCQNESGSDEAGTVLCFVQTQVLWEFPRLRAHAGGEEKSNEFWWMDDAAWYGSGCGWRLSSAGSLRNAAVEPGRDSGSQLRGVSQELLAVCRDRGAERGRAVSRERSSAGDLPGVHSDCEPQSAVRLQLP